MSPLESSDLFRPLKAAELIELERFLVSDATSDETLTLPGLDGYLTALVIGPTTVVPSRWLPGVWGGEDAEPEYDSMEQAQRIMTLLLRHMNSIVAEFETDPAAFEPIFDRREYQGRDYLCGGAWASGFMQGVELVRADWQPLFDHADMAEALTPLRLLGSTISSEEEKKRIETSPLREILTRQIPQSLVKIHGFWLPYRPDPYWDSVPPAPVRRAQPKVGRNDPCPCGSGAKFKKCCGAAGTRH